MLNIILASEVMVAFMLACFACPLSVNAGEASLEIVAKFEVPTHTLENSAETSELNDDNAAPQSDLSSETIAAWGQVSGGLVNVRSGPSTNHAIIRTLKGGDYIYCTVRKGLWVEINWPENAPAWISRHFVKPDGTVSGKRVRIRARGNLQAPVLREALQDEKVDIIGQAGDWYKIKAPATAKAYVFGKYALLGVHPPEGAVGTPPPEGAPKIEQVEDRRAETKTQPADVAKEITPREQATSPALQGSALDVAIDASQGIGTRTPEIASPQANGPMAEEPETAASKDADPGTFVNGPKNEAHAKEQSVAIATTSPSPSPSPSPAPALETGSGKTLVRKEASIPLQWPNIAEDEVSGKIGPVMGERAGSVSDQLAFDSGKRNAPPVIEVIRMTPEPPASPAPVEIADPSVQSVIHTVEPQMTPEPTPSTNLVTADPKTIPETIDNLKPTPLPPAEEVAVEATQPARPQADQFGEYLPPPKGVMPAHWPVSTQSK